MAQSPQSPPQSPPQPQESPHSMAQSAKDKFQTSASQFWSSIRSLSLEENMKKPVVSPESPAEEPSGGDTSLESVMRLMFGACAGASPDVQKTSKRDVESSETSSGSREKSKSTCEPISPNPSQEDAMYTQLFKDEQFRAEEAVSHLREQMEMRKEERSPQTQRQSPPHSKATKTLQHKFFPASSPGSPKKEREITVPNLVSDSPSPPRKHTNKQPHVLQNMSFDDGISAISADTLDEMARMYEVDETLLNRVYSDVTQDHVDTTSSVENWHGTAYRNNGMPSPRHGAVRMSPLRLARTGRSQGTINTKHSRGTRSFATKSTLSTETTEFASVFRKNEENYWQDVADEQDDPAKARRRMRSKDADLKSRKDSTVATERSSLYSSLGSKSKSDRRNPSGIVVNSPITGRIFSDPDRMMHALVVPPGTELGEI